MGCKVWGGGGGVYDVGVGLAFCVVGVMSLWVFGIVCCEVGGRFVRSLAMLSRQGCSSDFAVCFGVLEG